ncbi:nuclear transport factor 2 family protein [Lutimonas vermicola]|uniref:Nuclear transport factor 2 family protein n=1 Tax=Lutimonas vermicola TaxID=414288 RepID=A0ABU9L566_9FLAO
MKKVLLFALLLFIVPSCQNKSPERFKTASAEIDLLKKGLTDYENANWEEWFKQYADSAKIFQNTWSQFESPEGVMKRHQELITKLLSYSFDKENLFFEQVIDDKGRTWVNFWGLWTGKLKANEKIIEIPVHLNFQFINGKIVKEYGYWDTIQLYEELKKAEFVSSHKVAEEDSKMAP